MTIQRFDTGPRMSQVVIHGDTVYLAGVVANNAAGESVTKQTQDVLSIIDRPSGEGRQRQIETAVGDDLSHRHEDFRRDERGVGRLGVGGQYAGARHRRGQTRQRPNTASRSW